MELNLEHEPAEAFAGAIGQPVAGEQFIHVRVRDSESMDRIRTRSFGKGIVARIGFKNGKSHVISLLFNKKQWTDPEARSWWRAHRTGLASALAESVASVYVGSDLLDAPVETFGFTLPEPTPTKAYVVFKLLSFHPVVNARHDTFDEADIPDQAVASLVGSPIFGNDDLSDHFNRNGQRGAQVGAVLAANKIPGDGIYSLAALYKDVLEERYQVDPTELPNGFSVSMETRFDPDTSRYRLGTRILTRGEAVTEGIASLNPSNDDPRKYTARFLVPSEYHAVALLHRGRNADPSADVLLAAASVDDEEIEWHEADFEAFVSTAEAYGAVLTPKSRNRLRKSSFAYIDDEGNGHLPIHDAAHVKNALARLNQTHIPASAKQTALRKILSAARRFGVDIDRSSKNVKAYGAYHHHSSEERARILKALKRKRGMAKASAEPHLITIEGLSAIFHEDGTLYRADFDLDDEDELSFADAEEIGPITPSIEESTMTEQEIQEAIRAAREEAAQAASQAKEAELSAAFKAREAEIAQAALEQFQTSEDYKGAIAQAVEAAVSAYKESEEFKTLVESSQKDAIDQHTEKLATVAARLKELEGIHPFKDEAERQGLEAKVTETVADEIAWLRMRSERLEAALASVSRRVPTTAGRPTMPTLVAVASGAKPKDWLDLTDEEG